MLTYLVRRLFEFCVVILGVLTIVFVLQRFSGDPTNLLLPIDASEEVRAELRHQLGLDQSVPVQYVRFLADVAQGDLGESYRFRQPALGLVLERLPATLLLAGTSLLTPVTPTRPTFCTPAPRTTASTRTTSP